MISSVVLSLLTSSIWIKLTIVDCSMNITNIDTIVHGLYDAKFSRKVSACHVHLHAFGYPGPTFRANHPCLALSHYRVGTCHNQVTHVVH